MASASLTIVIDAENNATTALEDTNTSLDETSEKMDDTAESAEGLGGSFGGMAGQFVAGAAMFTVGQKVLEGLKSTISDAIQSYETWQINQAQLTNSLKTTNDASGQTVQGLDKYADTLSSQTGITGNAINSAQLLMLNYTAIGKNIFPEATTQVANLATALSGGAVPTTEQMSQAAKMLGKALEDPTTGVTALTRAHVTLSPAQDTVIKNMMATGNTAGAQTQLLSDLSDIVGGKAVTAAHTLAGEEAMLKADMEKVEIEVGQKLTAAFKTLEPYIADAISFLTQHKAILAAVAGAVAGLAIAIGVALVTALWAVVAPAVAAVLALWPIIAVAAAVALVAYEIVTHWDDVKQWFDDFINWIKNNWGLLLSILIGPLGLAIQWIVNNWSTISAVFIQVLHDIEGIWDGIVGFFSAIIDGIIAVVKTIVGIIVGIFKAEYNGVIAIWNAIVGFFSGLWSGIKAVIGTIVGFIVGIFRNEWNGMVAIWNGIGNFFGSVINAIKNAVSGFGSLLLSAGKDLINGLIQGIENAAGDVFNAVENIGSQAVSALKGVLKIFSPSQVFADLGTQIGAGLAQGITGSQTQVSTASSGLAQSAITGASSVTVPQPTSSIVSNNQSSNSNSNVNIQNLVIQLPTGNEAYQLISQLNQDTLNLGKGLTASQGLS